MVGGKLEEKEKEEEDQVLGRILLRRVRSKKGHLEEV